VRCFVRMHPSRDAWPRAARLNSNQFASRQDCGATQSLTPKIWGAENLRLDFELVASTIECAANVAPFSRMTGDNEHSRSYCLM
jgi:hypothetical protein